jgi:hypothetical protein
MPDFLLTPAHREALDRPRRIIDQMDANTPRDIYGIDLAEWLRLRFHHADMEGSQVDGFWWDISSCEEAYALYDSPSRPLLDDPGLQRWRDQGIDYVGTLLEETHRRGLECFWSHRVGPVDPAQPWADIPLADWGRRNPIKQEHPDWVQRCWWWQGLYDLSAPGLRAHKVAVLHELLDRYAFDGIQLDFSRHQPTLPLGRQWQLRDEATAFVREVREMLMEQERAQGRPILLSVKVPESVAGCAVDGLDVARWARELLVDIFVIGARTITIDIASFKRITAGTPLKVAATHDAHHSTDGYCSPSLEMFLGTFSNFWSQGADFVTVFNWPTAPEEHYTRLGTVGDVLPGTYEQHTAAMFLIGAPAGMAGAAKTFVAERRGGFPWTDETCFYCRNLDRPLPAALPNHGAPLEVALYVWDPGAAAAPSGELEVVLWAADPADQIEVRVGATTLREIGRNPEWQDGQVYADQPQQPAGNLGAFGIDPGQQLLQLRFELAPAALVVGENTVSLRSLSREPYPPRMYGTATVVEKVEAHLRGVGGALDSSRAPA